MRLPAHGGVLSLEVLEYKILNRIDEHRGRGRADQPQSGKILVRCRREARAAVRQTDLHLFYRTAALYSFQVERL